jgi:hypothetical protein
MKEIIRNTSVFVGGEDWSYLVRSNEDLNKNLFFHLVRVEMGGNKGIHKIEKDEHISC